MWQAMIERIPVFSFRARARGKRRSSVIRTVESESLSRWVSSSSVAERVVHHRHGADPQGRVIGDDELGHVGQEQADLVARLHPDRRQGFGEAVHQRLQFPVGDLLPHEDERREVGEPPGRPGQDLGHRDLLEIELPGDAGGVAPVPNSLKTHRVPPSGGR